MNFKQKKIASIALAVANLSFVISTASVATFAWFALGNASTKVTTDNMAITASAPDTGLTYEILKYNDNKKAGESFTYRGGQTPIQFTLPAFDRNITEKNIYANIIVRASVTFKDAIDPHTDEVSIQINRKALTNFHNTDDTIMNITSNVVQFKACVYSYTKTVSETTTTEYTSLSPAINESGSDKDTCDKNKYESARKYFAERITPTTFVSIKNNNLYKKKSNTQIVLTPDLPDPGDNTWSISNVVLYLEISYNKTLVDKYIQSFESKGKSVTQKMDGDINLINFDTVKKETGKSHDTGKYIKVDSTSGLSDGEYLITHEDKTGVSDHDKILKGSLSAVERNSTKTSIAGSLWETDVSNMTDVDINKGDDIPSIDRSDARDRDSFTKTQSGNNHYFQGQEFNGVRHYIGNNTDTEGIKSTLAYTNLNNTISFSGTQAKVLGSGGKQLSFNNDTPNRIAYFNANNTLNKQIDLYRYYENVTTAPTLKSIAVTTTPAAPSHIEFIEGTTFSLNNVSVIPTYASLDDGEDEEGSDVKQYCTYTTTSLINPQTLIPGTTTFTAEESGLVINVKYIENGVEKNDSFTVDVLSAAVESLSCSSPTSGYYYPQQTLTINLSDITVHVEYDNDDSADLLGTNALFNFKLNDGTTLNKSTGQLTLPNPVSDTTYQLLAYCNNREGTEVRCTVMNVYVKVKFLSFAQNSSSTTKTFTVAPGTNGTISFYSNITIDSVTLEPGKEGLLASCGSSWTYSGSNKAITSGSISFTAGSSTGQLEVTLKDMASNKQIVATIKIQSSWKLLTSSNIGDLTTGCGIIFAYGTYTAGELNSSYLTRVNDTTFTDGEITYGDEGSALQFILGGSSGSWTFKKSGTSDNYLKTSSKSLSFGTPASTWDLSFDSDDLSIEASDGTILAYNSSSPRFKTYDSYNDTTALHLSIYFLPGFDSVQSITANTTNLSKFETGTKVTPTSLFHAGLTVTATFSSENVILSPSDIVITSGATLSADGINTVSISYTDNSGKTVNTNFNVFARSVKSITLNTGSVKTSYSLNESFSSANLSINATYTDDLTANNISSGFSVNSTNFDSSEAGTYTITVSYTYGNATKTATYDVTVTATPVITLSSSNVSLTLSNTTQSTTVTATITNNSGADISVSSGNTGVATVAKSGSGSSFTITITAVAQGSATIIVTYPGATNKTISVSVKKPSISLSSSSMSLTAGGSNGTSTATITNPNGGSVTASSSDSTKASVVVSGSGSSFTITVTPVAAATGITITVSYPGADNATITVNVAESAGYTVSFNGNGATGSKSSVTTSGSYTLPNSTGFTKPSAAYGFAGWSVGSATANTIYASGASVTINSATTLYARWKYVSTLTFTSACVGSGTADNGVSWTVTSDAAESNYDSTKGVHYGTGSKAVSYLKLQTTSITSSYYITKIEVNASGASGTSAKLNVTVGGNAFGSQQSLTSTATVYTLTKTSGSSLTIVGVSTYYSSGGTILVSITQNSAKKAVYCKSITVTYYK